MSARRTFAVLAGLAISGAFLGTLAGAAVAGVVMAAWAISAPEAGFFALGFWIGGIIGGALGTILVPAVAFSPLRHVSLGRLFAMVTAGTIVAGAATALFTANLVVIVPVAIGGFVLGGYRALRGVPTAGAPRDKERASRLQ